jgi:hypothetical protein
MTTVNGRLMIQAPVARRRAALPPVRRTAMADRQDLKTFVASGEVQHVEFAAPYSFRELKIVGPADSVTFISVPVPVGLLRTLDTLDRGARVLVRGELAFVKGDRPQHCVKAVSIARVDPDGRVAGARVRHEAAAGFSARPAVDRHHRNREAEGSAWRLRNDAHDWRISTFVGWRERVTCHATHHHVKKGEGLHGH